MAGTRRTSHSGADLQHVVDEAARLTRADGAIVYLAEGEGDRATLRWMRDAGITSTLDRRRVRRIRLPGGVGLVGAAVEARTVRWTDDYSADTAFTHGDVADGLVHELGIRAMAAAPLLGSDTALGALCVYSRMAGGFGPDERRILGTLAEHAAAAIANERLIAELQRSHEELQRRVDAQRALTGIATSISAIRDPATVLQRAVDEAARVTGADGARIDLVADASGALHWAFGHSDIDRPIAGREGETVRADEGLSGKAVIEGRVVRTGDYLSDGSFSHADAPDRYVRENGIVSVMAAPLLDEHGALGTITVHAGRRDAFGPVDEELLGALAAHAAIAVSNARLYRALQERGEELGRRVEVERTLAAISGRIAELRDPTEVLQRTVDEAVRLLDAEAALINPLQDAETLGLAVAFAPRDAALDDVVVRVGEGVSGRALALGRVVATGDYLADPAFQHVSDVDAYVARREMRSVMSAPLVGGEGPIGVLTVQASRPHAFDEEAAELLGALAGQAAIAITNARLHARVEESERRYRYLVDTSPDVVWAVDEDGRFTFMSESWTRLTGRAPDEAIGRHWGEFTDPGSVAVAQHGWEEMRRQPERGHRMRIEILHREGDRIPVEINMIASLASGRFAGVHGAIRDVRDRERLEADLRRHAGELAAASERARLARELHDSVTQALFSMTMTTRTAEMLLDRDPAAARARLVELRQLQRDALAEMRSLIFELRPGNLEEDGLAEALRIHAAGVAGRTGLTVTVDAADGERLPIDLEHGLFRIAQEALHNVVKHAGAGRVQVQVRRAGAEVELVVEDDGVGFDPAAVAGDRLGLAGMRSRAEQLGGSLSLESRPTGTRLSARMPLGGRPRPPAATDAGDRTAAVAAAEGRMERA